jgi:hypothetical protein
MAYGTTPYIVRGGQSDYKTLFYSNPEAALRIDIQLQAGYGDVKMGTAMSCNDSAAGNAGKYVPYDPHATVTGAEPGTGRAYLVQNTGTTSPVVYVTLDDSYKFKVADDLQIHDDTTAAENLGAITAIDRTTYSHMAAITATTNIGGTAFTTARFAYVYCEGAVTADGILEESVQTGTGVNAQGGQGSLIIKNALLYNGMLTNVDSNARTDLSASVVGLYLKM